MRQQKITMSAQGISSYQCIDRRSAASTDILVVLDWEGGQGIASIEFTPDECVTAEPELWIEHDVITDLDHSCASTLNVPFQAFRLNVKRLTSGTVSARIVQGGDHDY